MNLTLVTDIDDINRLCHKKIDISPDKRSVFIVCGPTAGGKTQFAHQLALNNNGEVVNADSMQIYRQIPIITASPDQTLQSENTYHLYNFLGVDQEYSVIKYVQNAQKTIELLHQKGKTPVITGGTGMYISMLLSGYNDIPDIADDVRSEARSLQEKMGNQHLYEILKKVDPEIAKHLKPGDTQRIIRAYEVLQQTGKSILYFQHQLKQYPLDGYEVHIYYIRPNRDILYKSCNERFEYLFNNGAVEEVQQLIHTYPNLTTSASKALGIAQIIAYLQGKLSKAEAIEEASMLTRRYAKRQCTWFNNQIYS